MKEKVKKEKKSLRKRLELRFGRKASPPPKEAPKAASPPPAAGEQRIAPWRSNSSARAEPRVLHGINPRKYRQVDGSRSLMDF